MSVIVVIAYQTLPDQVDAGLQELTDLIEVVLRTEPDCLGIRTHRDTADPSKILLWEEWTTEEAFKGPHSETPHLTAFRIRARDLYVGPPAVTFWQETGRPGSS